MVSLSGVVVVLAVGLASLVPSAAATAAGPVQPPSITANVVAFSPNGDRVKDRARIRYTLPTASRVSVVVLGGGRKILRTSLDTQAAGPHTWSWDGRTPAGRLLDDGYYLVRLRTSEGSAAVAVDLDVRFQASVDVDERFGRSSSETPRIYPRTTVARDAIGLTAGGQDREYQRAQLQVRDPAGTLVLRRDLVKHPTGFAENGVWQQDPEVWEARDDQGRPLPPGLYSALVTGVDHVGNAGTSRPLPIRVSRRRLHWVEETRVVTAVESRVGMCARSEANGCGDVVDCGTVAPSDRFPGGLSLRSETCPGASGQPGATSYHQVSAAAAVRGIDSYRVSFTGAPTQAGETDPATLDVGQTTLTSSTGGQTPWLTEGPYLDGDRRLLDGTPRLPPSAWWRMSTTGTDSFDVASYTVDLRYLGLG